MAKSPDILLMPNFIDNHNTLFDELKTATVWDNRFKVRKTASYGVAYNYSGIDYPEIAMPYSLTRLCDTIEMVLSFRPNNCLLNYYLDGNSSMGYHSDMTDILAAGTGVVIISLESVNGMGRHIHYQEKANRKNEHQYLLNSGDLLYMDDKVQADWLHAIPKDIYCANERISLTFRKIIS